LASIDLTDFNDWLSLAWEDCLSHQLAQACWKHQAPPKVVLWSITHLDLVRLLSFTFINTV
jgi:hypothetical protein